MIISQINIRDIYRTSHTNTKKKCTLFSAAHLTFSKRHKTSLNKFRKSEITSCILSSHISGYQQEVAETQTHGNKIPHCLDQNWDTLLRSKLRQERNQEEKFQNS